MLTVIRTTITMGIGYRKVSTATQIIPTVRVFEKSMERMEPTISAGMICSVIFFSFLVLDYRFRTISQASRPISMKSLSSR